MILLLTGGMKSPCHLGYLDMKGVQGVSLHTLILKGFLRLTEGEYIVYQEYQDRVSMFPKI